MKNLLLLALPLFLFACAGEPKGEAAKEQETRTENNIPDQVEIQSGQINHDIPCGDGQTYDLYLPKNYDASKSWPILVAFDPHGDGTLPLKNYQGLADEFGLIMAGSNYSKNGLDINLINQHYQGLRKDLLGRVNSSNRLYMLGFSGGGKVATQIGLGDDNVVGIIACGAATKFKKPEKNLLYAGIAGKGDFNYPGMFYSYQVMDKMGVSYVFQTFDGKHEWAPKENVAKVLRWFALDGMKSGAIAKDKDKIQEWKLETEKEIGSIKPQNTLGFYTAYTNLVKMYDGLADVTSFNNAAERMKTSGRVDEALKKFDNLLKNEEGQKSYYMKAMDGENLAWWQQEVKRLKEEQSRATGEAKYATQRTIGFLGLAVYMQASSAIDKKKNQEAGKLVSIYLLLEPENPEAHYLNAVLSARTGDDNGALEALKKAKNFGLTNTQRLQTLPDFDGVRGMDGFRELL